jgi:fructose-specific phosphotransferase system IIA component
MLLGFNFKGALRIGVGMVPRGEVALIIAGIGLASGILDESLFGVVILMTLFTTLAAPPFLGAVLRIPGHGTKNPLKGDDTVSAVWEFHSGEIADLVVDLLLKDLRAEGFYVQMMNIEDGLSQARKGDIALSITEEESTVTIETSQADMTFVKTAVYEVILRLNDSIQQLKDSANPSEMKKELMDTGGRTSGDLLSLIREECFTLNLRGKTKEEIITELVDMLAEHGKLDDRDQVLSDVLQREATMSTGMEHGIALPHAKSDGVKDICAAVGIAREGLDFEALDGERSRLFIMVVSPKKISGPHVQFLAAVGSVLNDPEIREQVINSRSIPQAIKLLRKEGNR